MHTSLLCNITCERGRLPELGHPAVKRILASTYLEGSRSHSPLRVSGARSEVRQELVAGLMSHLLRNFPWLNYVLRRHHVN